MATAKRLPSGGYRCQAYDKTVNGKRIYKSFTASTKKEAEYLAAQFQLEKKEKQKTINNMTVREAINAYIDSREYLNLSPTTIQDYKCIKRFAFQDIMDMKLEDLDESILQEAVNMESQRKCTRKAGKTITAKRLRNEWGLLSSTLHKYAPGLKGITEIIELPRIEERVPDLIPAEVLLPAIVGTDIELAVLLAAWLSFTMSEVRGLTKSKSISGDYIRIAEVTVVVDGKDVTKSIAKNKYRNRTHRIPPYIKGLIDKVDGDRLVPYTGPTLYHKWIKFLDANNLPHMTFHDLRHLNASVMALLRIPDKYAQDRGGWKSDYVMKKVYTQTFPEARVQVDNKIDNYFDNIISPEQTDYDVEKYNAWLKLFDKNDSEESKKEFLNFIGNM